MLYKKWLGSVKLITKLSRWWKISRQLCMILQPSRNCRWTIWKAMALWACNNTEHYCSCNWSCQGCRQGYTITYWKNNMDGSVCAYELCVCCRSNTYTWESQHVIKEYLFWVLSCSFEMWFGFLGWSLKKYNYF
jgi:hypothetical protein